MNRVYTASCVLLLLIVVVACTNSSDSSDDEASSSVNQDARQSENYTYNIEFSTGFILSPENGSADNLAPQQGRREDGGIEFDSISFVIDESSDEGATIGGSLRFYFADPIVSGENSLSEIVGVAAFPESDTPDSLFACDPADLDEITITITELTETTLSGNIPSITLDQCSNYYTGESPEDERALVVSGTFENIPYDYED